MLVLLRVLANVFLPASPRAWRRAMLQIVGAVTVFGLWHSLLCSRGSKRLAQRLCGERAGRAFYRLFFNLQAVAATLALVWFVVTRPQRILYRAQGAARWPFWLGQGASLVVALWSVRELHFRRFSGVQGISDLKHNRPEIAAPEAQTPDGEDGPYERGPYRWSRHPVEWAPLCLLWLTPTLKTNWLAFNAITTLYMLLGVWHEEKRLEAQGGEAYARYQQRVRLFFGRSRGKSSA